MENPIMERPGINWGELHSGHITQREILVCVNDEQWQLFRESLRGEALDEKFIRLKYWLRAHRGEYPAKVQVTNYVNALARGGLISPVNKTD